MVVNFRKYKLGEEMRKVEKFLRKDIVVGVMVLILGLGRCFFLMMFFFFKRGLLLIIVIFKCFVNGLLVERRIIISLKINNWEE